MSAYSIVKVVGKDYIRRQDLRLLKDEKWKEFFEEMESHAIRRIDEKNKEMVCIGDRFVNTRVVLIAQDDKRLYLATKGMNSLCAAKNLGNKIAQLVEGRSGTMRWLPNVEYDWVWKDKNLQLEKDRLNNNEEVFKIVGMKNPDRTRPNHSDVSRGAGKYA